MRSICTFCFALVAFGVLTEWTNSQDLTCPYNIIFVVDESEIMRTSTFTKDGKIAFKRVNDQIVSYLQSMSQVSTAAAGKAGYIGIGMDLGARKAARQIIGLSTDLTAVINAINGIKHQDIALLWDQIIKSLPALIPEGSKVIIITATEVSQARRAAVSAALPKTKSEFYAIGLNFKSTPLTTAGLVPLATNASNVKIITSFDDTSVKSQLELFIPVACPKGVNAVCSNIMDVVVVVDGSFSIGENTFNNILKQTLIGLTDNLFSLGRDLKIGVVLFSHQVDAKIELSSSITDVKKSINDLPYPNGATFTFLGIEAARDLFAKFGRKAATKLMIIITDGESSNTVKTAQEATLAKNADIVIYAVGVGQATQTELRAIASTPSHVLQAANYEELATQLKALTAKCAVDGAWSDWTLLRMTDCSVTCGTGTRTRFEQRTCTNPAPKNGGKDCGTDNSRSFSVNCDTGKSCSAWGPWSGYQQITQCSVTCGSGGVLTTQRTRVCVNDVPGGNGCGAPSPQRESKTELCTNTKPCPSWGPWSSYNYGSCSVTCGPGGTQTGVRSRTCLNDVAGGQGCGAPSPQSQQQIKQCGLMPACPQWGPWSGYSFGTCSVTCGSGTQAATRSRTCLNDNTGTGCGAASPQVDQTQKTCLMSPCPQWGPWSGYSAISQCSATCGSGGRWTTQSKRVCNNDNASKTGCGASSPQTKTRTELCSSSRTCPYWAAWSGYTYGPCSATCGTGITRTGTRQRICLNDIDTKTGCGAKSPQVDQQIQQCAVQPCPAWGPWSAYTAVSPCSKTCGSNGVQTLQRKRNCQNDNANRLGCGSLSPDVDTVTQVCSPNRNCPNWGPWTAYTYGPCSKTCGLGAVRTANRTRRCENDISSGLGCGAKSPEIRSELVECNFKACPRWGPWSPYQFGPCSVTCGPGGTWTKQRTRSCINDNNQHNGCGSNSPQYQTETEDCVSPRTCPFWGSWSGYVYGKCSATCGSGVTRTGIRKRHCRNDIQAGNGCGATSPQTDPITQPCNLPSCPLWGPWTTRTIVTPCSVTCGSNGVQFTRRSRVCNNDRGSATACGSKSPQVETQQQSCSAGKPCPVWGTWGAFVSGPCSATCGTDIKRIAKRYRTCENDDTFGIGCGAKSPQEDVQIVKCDDKPCPSWGLWSNYIPTGPCSATCGPNGVWTLTRSRVCNNDVQNKDGCGSKSPQQQSKLESCPQNPKPCPSWTSWSPFSYSACSVTCGTGTRTGTSTRSCLNDVTGGNGCGSSSPQTRQQTEACSGQACPTWSLWSGFTPIQPCSVTCGTGGSWQVQRTRTCMNDNTAHNACGANSPQQETKTDTCTSPVTCPYWAAWSGYKYGDCSATCGSGVTRIGVRMRVCNNDNKQKNGCGATSPMTETKPQPCNVPACPLWGTWSDFAPASKCSVTCGSNGSRLLRRTRICNNDNTQGTGCGSKSPEIDSKTETCSANRACPSWGPWAAFTYGPCSKTCGGGVRTGRRTRTCQNDVDSGFGCGAKSPEEEENKQTCSENKCPAWSTWSRYTVGPCSVTCGSGGTWTKSRSRVCNDDNGQANACGASSPQTQTKTEPCTSSANCPYWGAWSGYTFGPCSATCGTGITRTGSRTRICYNDNKQGNGCGSSSPQTQVESSPCKLPDCPLWGSWSLESAIGKCSVTCGTNGVVAKRRQRVCNNDVPGGRGCGSQSPDEVIRNVPCDNVRPCPVWDEWSANQYTGCTATCGAGATRVRTRTRTCLNDIDTKLGCGAKSPETDEQTEECVLPACPKWSPWSQFTSLSACSVTCGSGGTWTVQRSRTCSSDNNAHNACGAVSPQRETQTESCVSSKSCPFWSPWSGYRYDRCTATCGAGITRLVTRTRICQNDEKGSGCGAQSPQVDRQTQDCQLPLCPAWGTWSGYTPIEACSKTCGTGGLQTTRRQRKCENDVPDRTACGAKSPQWETRRESCSTNKPCPVWSNWSTYIAITGCSITCGNTGGVQTVKRTRTCLNDVPGGGGCGIGDTEQTVTRACNPNIPCPTDGQWGPWKVQSVGPCSVTCGKGVKNRNLVRACDSPAPQNNGKDCPVVNGAGARKVEPETCNIRDCPRPAVGLCDSARVVKGVGYRLHPTDCDKYILCYYRNTDGYAIGVVKQCPFDNYWDQNELKCKPACNVQCPLEKCKNTDIATYNMDGSCRGFWQCNNGKSEGQCCPVGFAYVHNKGCQVDFTCKDKCPYICSTKGVCAKRPVWNNTNKFESSMGSLGWFPSSCLRTSLYYDTIGCECSSAATSTCTPMMSMDFSNPNSLSNNQGIDVSNKNVQISQGVGKFSGNSQIHTNIALTEASVEKPVAVVFQYKESSVVVDRKIILSAPQCTTSKSSALIFALEMDTFAVEVVNWYGARIRMAIGLDGFSTQVMKQVQFIYDGKYLTATVQAGNRKYAQRAYAPMIGLIQCGLDFGTDGKNAGFSGDMDTIGVFRCDPTKPVV